MEQQLLICIYGMAAGIIVLTLALILICRQDRRHLREMDRLQRKKEAMEALNRETAELAHHQRLETIGTLTSSIAHEFNNLLTPIMGYSMLALEKIPPEEEDLYDSIVAIYESSRKAKVLVSRLSDLSRKNTETSFQPLSPDEVIRKTLDIASPAQTDNIEVKLNLNCWDQRISANEIQLTQLFLNLFLNAFHAMETKGGVLTVSSDPDEENILIHVADTGCGIPADIQSKIFEPFFTTKDTGRGTGLGLAIAAQMVEDHHGSITVDSTEGAGTVFTVVLPRL